MEHNNDELSLEELEFANAGHTKEYNDDFIRISDDPNMTMYEKREALAELSHKIVKNSTENENRQGRSHR